MATQICIATLTTPPLPLHDSYFGFLKYAFGTGCLLIFAGSLILGMVWPWGLITGIFAMVIGLFQITLHCWGKARHHEVAQTEPVTGNYA